jgi:hypothetical protein
MEAESQRERRLPPAVRARVDHRHHGVDLLVCVPVHPPEQRQVDGVRTGHAGRVHRGGGVLDRDDSRAEPVRLGRDPERAPERVVEHHHVRPDRSQGLLHRTCAEREPVPVRGDEAQRAQLVAAGRVALAARGDDHVVLERAGRIRELGLLVEIGPNPPASLPVQERNIRHDESLRASSRGRGSADH